MDSFDGLWSELAPIGRHAGTGGYRRFAFDPAELACREWFVATAQARGLDVETDRNSNIWLPISSNSPTPERKVSVPRGTLVVGLLTSPRAKRGLSPIVG